MCTGQYILSHDPKDFYSFCVLKSCQRGEIFLKVAREEKYFLKVAREEKYIMGYELQVEVKVTHTLDWTLPAKQKQKVRL